MINYSKKIALVTGGGGFLGRYIVKELLAKGVKTRIYGRTRHPDLEKLGVQNYCGDIAQGNQLDEATQGADVVFHVAAKAGIWGAYQKYYSSNVVGTQKILEASKKNRVPHFVYTSTPSVVFTGKSFQGADETLPYGSKWLCAYPQTKAIAEKIVLQTDCPNFSTLALRPHLLWGVGDNHLIPRLIAKATSKKLRQVGDGNNKVDLVHVKNAARAHQNAWETLMTKSISGKAYFISEAKPVNLWKWIQELLIALQLPPITKTISLRKAYLMGATLEKIHHIFPLIGEPQMTRFLALQLAKSHYFSIESAKRDLSYQPIITQQQGIQELIRAHLNH